MINIFSGTHCLLRHHMQWIPSVRSLNSPFFRILIRPL